ncbi:hypothetical protein [Mesonia aquimarina]|uniref:hypothetical protein n=1 Tax=Mesonia aquimarina TaxID=1504967 RepID=UPI000EF59A5B|nr:hypothetical protein [Mesonia aquimarina]
MELIIYIITGIIGAILPYFLTRNTSLDAVKASALPSLILGMIFYLFPNLVDDHFQKNIPLLFFGASFVGMVSKKVLQKYMYVAIAGVLFALLYKNSSNFFNGYGGGLGTAACISVLCVFGLKKLKSLARFFRIQQKN